MIVLAPAAGEPELGDPACVGAWAAELPKMLAAAQVPPWCSYVARRGGVPVGMGGFKGPPDAAGSVEIAYLTFRPAEGQGVAREVAARLVELAAEQGVTRLHAHTLPQRNASTAVLERNGFTLARQVQDPDDGAVWRWERRLDEAAPAD